MRDLPMIFTLRKKLSSYCWKFEFLGFISASLMLLCFSAVADENTNDPSAVGLNKPLSAVARECIDLNRVRSIFSTVNVSLSPSYDTKTGESARFDECDTKRLSYKLIKALVLLEDIGPALPGEIKPVVKSTYWDYFKSKVELLVLDKAKDGMCDGPYVGAYASGNRTIHVCPILSKYSTFDIAGALVHEARHLVGEGYGHLHVICKQGIFNGSKGCDESVEAGGAYGIQYKMMLRTANTVSIDPLIRKEAANAIPRFVKNHFNVRPLKIP